MSVYDQDRFETLCRVINKALTNRGDEPLEITVDADERAELVSALTYYRAVVDPHSGDVVRRIEYACPGCGAEAEFRAQGEQMSKEAERPDIGVEVFEIRGIAQCGECGVQTALKQFRGAATDGFDEEGWDELYRESYRERETVARL